MFSKYCKFFVIVYNFVNQSFQQETGTPSLTGKFNSLQINLNKKPLQHNFLCHIILIAKEYMFRLSN